MFYSNAQSLLLILFKSNQREKTVIPSILSSFGDVYTYKSFNPTNSAQGWNQAFITEIKDEQNLYHLDTKTIIDAVQKEYNAENLLIAPMIHSIECIKDTSNDLENDVFFAVAFSLEEKLDQFPEDWFKATPYMSSWKYFIRQISVGFKRATVYKVIGDNPPYPFLNIAVWSSLDSWKQAISTEESKQAHVHQTHVQRTPFIGKFVQSSSSN